MADRTPLRPSVERLAGRLRALPQRRLQAGAAAEGLALARWLARQAQTLEFPGREPYELPDDGVFTVGDQLSVAGNEVAAALEADPAGTAEVCAAALQRVSAAAKAIG
ncbi:hypothetical protein [Streptomyces sp. CBMA29]|uniref:hypothetical protein n=1 Tax=Streptomyces sp. CBMA29 TaxID=1896314 RepID=UPI0016621A94|nr:hypothetical protein [Streptomyces sp. CBMA29]MBD0739979.1 hypothetical protein [Streptomyces sp. CBMA29]